MNPLRSLPEYEVFIYTLAQRFPIVPFDVDCGATGRGDRGCERRS